MKMKEFGPPGAPWIRQCIRTKHTVRVPGEDCSSINGNVTIKGFQRLLLYVRDTDVLSGPLSWKLINRTSSFHQMNLMKENGKSLKTKDNLSP